MMTNDASYFGHMTFADGTHRPLTKSEDDAISREFDAWKAETARMMPDESSTLAIMARAYHRMGDFGWRDAIYCPKDGSFFDVVEAGSGGIFRANYRGEWPDGQWWVYSDGDIYSSRPILFRDKQNV